MTNKHPSSISNTNINSFAEIIESSLDKSTAQCWEWDNLPRFGSIVSFSSNPDIITLGCVTHVTTGSMDPMRYPYPYKKTEAELRQEQPQIFEFLKTTFTIQMLGQIDQTPNNHKILYMTPLQPAKIHTFVEYTSAHLVHLFFQNPDYLHVLFAHATNLYNIDELLLALNYQLLEKKLITPETIRNLCQTFSLLTGNDYRRLKLFLSRIQAFL